MSITFWSIRLDSNQWLYSFAGCCIWPLCHVCIILVGTPRFELEPYQLWVDGTTFMLNAQFWHHWEESNPYSHFRRMLSYPLNDSGMVRVEGFEPSILSAIDFKSIVYPIPPHSQELYSTSYNLARQVLLYIVSQPFPIFFVCHNFLLVWRKIQESNLSAHFWTRV